MKAPWLGPPRDAVNLWHITDTHINFDGHVHSMPRCNDIIAGIESQTMMRNMHARIHTGDITELAKSDQIAAAAPWIANNFSDVPDVVAYGNHDYGNGSSGYVKTLTQVEADYGGKPGLQATYAGPPGSQVRLLAQAPPSYPGGSQWVFDDASLAWLEARLQEDSTTPTFICNHFSIGATEPEASFADLISAYPNIEAWICGHAHYPVTDIRSVTTKVVGNRNAFPQYCGPSTTKTWGQAQQQDAQFPFNSFVISYLGPDRHEVRYRGHGNRQWVRGYGGKQVTVVVPG